MGERGPLRILLSAHHDLDERGGVAGSTRALAEGLAERGHEVQVCGFDLLERRRGAVRDALAYPHALAREVRRRLGGDGLDVVDASTGDLAYVGRSRIAASSCAFFTRSHGLEQLAARRRREGARRGELALRARYRAYHGGFRLHEVRRSLEAADGVLLLNDAEVAYATNELGLSSTRVWRTAPLAAALPAPRARAARDVLVLGPCSWRKGGDVALRVVEHLLRADPNLSASWHGLEHPDELAGRLAPALAVRVAFGGRYDPQTLSDLLGSHRVLLCCSRSEGLPVTLLEALASGIACVGTDVPGVRDLLAGVGLLAPDGHVEALTAAVRSLLGDEDLRQRLARSGREVASSPRWHRDAVLDELLGAYREVLSVKRPGR